MADIFLSYAKEDRETAQSVATLLERAGWSVWWDRRIPAGRTWREVLEEALRGMRCMVVLWSSHSVHSDWVKEEAEEARALKKLVPVLIEAVNPPVGFRAIQAADLTDWDGVSESVGARRLIGDLELLFGKPAPRVALDSKSSIPREQNAGQSSGENGSVGVKAEPDAGRPVPYFRGRLKKEAVPWKIVAGAGVALALALGVIARWNDSAPVMEPVAVMGTTSLPDTPPAPKLVTLGVHAARQDLKPDETLALSVRGRFSDGSESEITNAVEWSSSDARVGKVDAEGRVKALLSGTTKITATYEGVSSPAWTLVVKPAPTVKVPLRKIAVEPQPQKTLENVPRKTSTEAVTTKTLEPRPSSEPQFSPEQLRARIAPYISRAKDFRVQGNYGAALAELATALAIDPANQEIRAEIEQTRRACLAERRLGRGGLDCG